MTQGLLPPVVAADPGRGHTVFEWTVPLRYGDTAGRGRRRAHLDAAAVARGWCGRSTSAPALLAAAAGLLARTARPLGALMLVGAAAALWHAGATPVPALSVSSHTGGDPRGAAAGAHRGAGGGHRLPGRPPRPGVMTGLFAVVLGWLLLVQGLPDVDVLWSANVLTNGPQAVGRVAVALLLALGAGFVVGGIAAVRRFREVAVPEPKSRSCRTDPPRQELAGHPGHGGV